MLKVAIIGATGSLGRATTKELLKNETIQLTLFSRTVNHLPEYKNTIKIAGDVAEKEKLKAALIDQDLVFVALSGNLPDLITKIIEAMNEVKSKRIIFISSYGIYGELPGQNGRVENILKPYRQAADILEKSNLAYTILRPGWFDHSSDSSYELIEKGQIVYGNHISRQAIAQFVRYAAEHLADFVYGNYAIVRLEK